MNKDNNTAIIKNIATKLGFDFCGIAKATRLDEDADRLERWLHHGYHGKMEYMSNHFDLRTDPALLVPGAKSVITVLYNYYTDEAQTGDYKISKYAYGEDYHDVIRKKLHLFHDEIKIAIGDFNARGFIDSAPVLERSWARHSGLGWIGKNGNLINKKQGSFFFIATLIADIELNYDNPYTKDYCGTCTSCIDNCPTEAILPDKVVDGSKCISYFTIELKDALIPDNMKNNFNNWIFGCDVCQDVCPWNRFSKPHQEEKFKPLPEIINFKDKDWEELTEESFKIIFKNSPVKRTKFSGIKRNLQFIKAAKND